MAKAFVDSKGLTRYRFTFGPWNAHEGAAAIQFAGSL